MPSIKVDIQQFALPTVLTFSAPSTMYGAMVEDEFDFQAADLPAELCFCPQAEFNDKPDSLFFNDGVRRIDFTLVYEDEDKKEFEKRHTFQRRKVGSPVFLHNSFFISWPDQISVCQTLGWAPQMGHSAWCSGSRIGLVWTTALVGQQKLPCSLCLVPTICLLPLKYMYKYSSKWRALFILSIIQSSAVQVHWFVQHVQSVMKWPVPMRTSGRHLCLCVKGVLFATGLNSVYSATLSRNSTWTQPPLHWCSWSDLLRAATCEFWFSWQDVYI